MPRHGRRGRHKRGSVVSLPGGVAEDNQIVGRNAAVRWGIYSAAVPTAPLLFVLFDSVLPWRRC
jgi:hypothetical protein